METTLIICLAALLIVVSVVAIITNRQLVSTKESDQLFDKTQNLQCEISRYKNQLDSLKDRIVRISDAAPERKKGESDEMYERRKIMKLQNELKNLKATHIVNGAVVLYVVIPNRRGQIYE